MKPRRTGPEFIATRRNSSQSDRHEPGKRKKHPAPTLEPSPATQIGIQESTPGINTHKPGFGIRKGWAGHTHQPTTHPVKTHDSSINPKREEETVRQ
jgi:hypothetical protein